MVLVDTLKTQLFLERRQSTPVTIGVGGAAATADSNGFGGTS